MKRAIVGLAIIILLVFLAAVAYVRLAPSDPERWHTPVAAQQDADLVVGAVRVAMGDKEALARLATAMGAVARTELLAGSVEEGRVTYVTRSRVFGFPDYTTIEAADGQVRAFGRLRFGQSDLGVNAARLDRVFAAAGL